MDAGGIERAIVQTIRDCLRASPELSAEVVRGALAEALDRAARRASDDAPSAIVGRVEQLFASWFSGASGDRASEVAECRAVIERLSANLEDLLRSAPAPAPAPEGVDGGAWGDRLPIGESTGRRGAEALWRKIRGDEAAAPLAAAAGDSARKIGEYTIVRRIGGGGMGDVYEAYQESLDRPVALKVLSRTTGDTGTALERLLREAKAAGKLQHPSILAVYDAGIAGGRPFIAMQLVRGASMAEALGDKKPFGVARSLEIVRDLARALDAAHAAGIIHRDIKPGNVLFEGDRDSVRAGGRVYLIDFGLAHLGEGDSLTRTGEVLGTPSYMAPEQARGEQAGARSDVYSLGATLYALLTGRAPFEGSSHAAILLSVANEEPVSVRRLSSAVDRDAATICEKAMRFSPRDRYASAAALADDIERRLRHEPVEAKPAGYLYRARLWTRRNRRVVVAVLAVLAACLALVVGERWRRRDSLIGKAQEQVKSGHYLEAREILEQAPSHFVPGGRAAERPLRIRCLRALGYFAEAVKEARRLPAVDGAGTLESIREDLGRRLKRATEIASDGLYWLALRIVWETMPGIEELEVDFREWAPSARRTVGLVAVLALVNAKKFEMARELGRDAPDDDPPSIERVRGTILAAFLPARRDLNPLFGEIFESFLASAQNPAEYRLVLETAGLTHGYREPEGTLIFELAEARAAEAALAEDDPPRREVLALFRFLSCYQEYMPSPRRTAIDRWISLLEKTRVWGVWAEDGTFNDFSLAVGDLDGDGSDEAVVVLERAFDIVGSITIARPGYLAAPIDADEDIFAIHTNDLDGDRAAELLCCTHSRNRRDYDLKAWKFEDGTLVPYGTRTYRDSGPVLCTAFFDTDHDGTAELVAGTASSGALGRSVFVMESPFCADSEPEMLRWAAEGKRRQGDVSSVFGADIDRDGRLEIGSTVGPWGGGGFLFWKRGGERYEVCLDSGPMGSCDFGAPFRVAGGGAVHSGILFAKSSYVHPGKAGIREGLYLFRFEDCQAKPGEPMEEGYFRWADLFTERVVDPPASLRARSLAVNSLAGAVPAFALSWSYRADGHDTAFVDFYSEGESVDAFIRHRIAWRDGVPAPLVQFGRIHDSACRRDVPELFVLERRFEAPNGRIVPAQALCFALDLEVEEPSVESEAIEAFVRSEFHADAVALAERALRNREKGAASDKTLAPIALTAARAAVRRLDWEAGAEALDIWRRCPAAGVMTSLDSAGAAERQRLEKTVAFGRKLSSETPLRLVPKSEFEVHLPAGPWGGAAEGMLYTSRPFRIPAPSGLTISFDIAIAKIGWNRSIFVCLVRDGKPHYGAYVAHGGGGGLPVRNIDVLWGAMGSGWGEADLDRLLEEGHSYSVDLAWCLDGRVRVVVSHGLETEEAVKRPPRREVDRAIAVPSYDLTLPLERDCPEENALAGAVEPGEYRIGIWGRTLPPDPVTEELEETIATIRNLEVRVAPVPER